MYVSVRASVINHDSYCLYQKEKAKGPKERVVLSAATQRSMHRKKRYDGKEEHSLTFRC